MLARLLIVALLVSSCTGCAGIQVEPLDGTPKTMTGVPYVLPMTVYTLTIKRQANDCLPDKGMQVQVQVSVASKKAPDPAARFTLSSNGWFDTSDIKIGYDTDGATSGVNTSAADQTGVIITQAVTTLATMAPLLAGAGRPNPGASPETVCSHAVVEALAAIGRDGDDTHTAVHGLKDAVSADTAALTDINGRITTVSSQISTLGKDADLSLRRTLGDLIGQQHDLQTKLGHEQDDLTKALAVVTDTRTVQWPKDGQQWVSAADDPDLGLSDEAWARWTKGLVIRPEARAQYRIYLAIQKKGPLGQVGTPGQTLQPVSAAKGIPVRFPVPATLLVCKSAPCGAQGSESVTTFDSAVLQFGLVYSVPAKGGAFASTTFALQLDPNGAPSSVEVANQTAIVAAAATTANSAATQIAGIPIAIQNAKLAAVTAQSNTVTAQNTLATARATAATIAQLAPLQAANTLIQAQTAQATNEIALAAAKASQSNSAQLAPLQAETALTQAQTAQLTAAAALAAANAANGSNH